MKTKLRDLCWVCSIMLLMLCVASQAQDARRFTSFDFPDAIDTEPTSISPDGQIVGLYVSSDGLQHGFLLAKGKFQSIDFPGSTQTAARWINPRGQIVGEYTDTGRRQHGYLLSGGRFTSFDYPGAESTVAFGIGATGDIVGPWVPLGPFTLHGFLLSKGNFSTVDFPVSYVDTSDHDCRAAYRRRLFRRHFCPQWLPAEPW